MMVLCSTCGDAVPEESACGTCGEAEPQNASGDSFDSDALLSRVSEALRSQSELACKTAGERMATARELYEETLVLRRRLGRQAALMRGMLSERRDLQERFAGPLGRLDSALSAWNYDLSCAETRFVDVLLPRDPSCGTVARRVLEGHLDADTARVTVENAMLIVSELATNAMIHGEGTIELRAESRDGRLRIEVTDAGDPEWLGVLAKEQHDVAGRGLWLVEQLSETWGAETGPTRVWAELSLTNRGEA
jgi:anti-sigma regulatory factor (Ser/Thr protein kinase)